MVRLGKQAQAAFLQAINPLCLAMTEAYFTAINQTTGTVSWWFGKPYCRSHL
jgi:hypothetical protein